MVGHNGHCLGKVRIGTFAEGRMHYDHRGNENNSNKYAGDALRSANTRNGGGVCITDSSIPSTGPHLSIISDLCKSR